MYSLSSFTLHSRNTENVTKKSVIIINFLKKIMTLGDLKKGIDNISYVLHLISSEGSDN